MPIARYLRGVHNAQRYARPHEVWRSKIVGEAEAFDPQTGESLGMQPIRKWRKRRVNRRVKYMRGHRGFLSINDGLAMAANIARIVEYHRPEPPDWFDEPVERGAVLAWSPSDGYCRLDLT